MALSKWKMPSLLWVNRMEMRELRSNFQVAQKAFTATEREGNLVRFVALAQLTQALAQQLPFVALIRLSYFFSRGQGKREIPSEEFLEQLTFLFPPFFPISLTPTPTKSTRNFLVPPRAEVRTFSWGRPRTWWRRCSHRPPPSLFNRLVFPQCSFVRRSPELSVASPAVSRRPVCSTVQPKMFYRVTSLTWSMVDRRRVILITITAASRGALPFPRESHKTHP